MKKFNTCAKEALMTFLVSAFINMNVRTTEHVSQQNITQLAAGQHIQMPMGMKVITILREGQK